MKKFEEGKTYKRESGRKLVSTFTVGKRTACYVFEKTCFGIENRYKIHVSENGAFEYIEVKEGRHVHTYRADMEFVRDIENTVENTEVTAEENTENTADTPVENVEVKTFEVGKTYYSAENGLKIKVIKHTDKMIYIERDTNSIALNSRYAVLEYNGVEYINLGEYLNYACIYATDEISDTENAADNAEVKPLETADNKITDELSKVQSCIAATKKHISDETLKLAELEKKAAELETAIANQRLIDALEDIGGSAEAIDASVAEMEKLNSANNFSAEMLNAVIAQAEKAVEIVPVTFELQHFAADMVTADTVATIDTALTDTAILPLDEVDEDAEFQAMYRQISLLSNRAEILQEQIKKLTAERNEILKECSTLETRVRDYNVEIQSAARERIVKAFEKNRGGVIEVKVNDWSDMWTEWRFGTFHYEFNIGTTIENDGVIIWMRGAETHYQRLEIVKYSTIKQFKEVIHELAVAIERGDETFTFPADTPIDGEKEIHDWVAANLAF